MNTKKNILSQGAPLPDRCIACTSCTVVCPVAAATPEYLGPRMMGPAYERFRLAGLGEDKSLHYCSNCKNCEITCPNDVPVAAFIMRARASETSTKKISLRDWVLSHGEFLGKKLHFFPNWLINGGMNFSITRYFLDFFGIARKAPLPSFAAKNFHTQFRAIQQPPNLPRKVALFPGCFVSLYNPECGVDIVTLCNKAGYEVFIPKDFVCCGLPMLANGFWDDAEKNAQKNISALVQWKAKNIPIVTGCTSCSLMFTEEYHHFFAESIPEAFNTSLVDACEFVLQCVERGELSLPKSTAPKPTSVAYHAPCHLRAQGMGLPGLELLQRIPSLAPVNTGADCCGISGSYGFKKDTYEISMKIGAPLFEAIEKTGASISASECGTCRIQMEHGSNTKALHPLTLLRQYLDTVAP